MNMYVGGRLMLPSYSQRMAIKDEENREVLAAHAEQIAKLLDVADEEAILKIKEHYPILNKSELSDE